MSQYENDPRGNRMKKYEGMETSRILMPNLPYIVRLDGRSFHTLTRDLKRPYDVNFSRAMIDTVKYLMKEVCADLGYTASDEISLVFLPYAPPYEPIFGGRIFKVTSILASLCSVYFNFILPKYLPHKTSKLPIFDCRVFNLPNNEEVVEYLKWRELDATRNSISMAAQSVYSHKQLQNKNSAEMHEMLFQAGINYNDYPAFFKRGTYIKRFLRSIKFTTEEINKLPVNHAARKNPDLQYKRHVIEEMQVEPITKLLNPIATFLEG